jgi:hypothetical protein
MPGTRPSSNSWKEKSLKVSKEPAVATTFAVEILTTAGWIVMERNVNVLEFVANQQSYLNYLDGKERTKLRLVVVTTQTLLEYGNE